MSASVSNIVRTINKSITNVLTSTFQNSTVEATAIQSLFVDCTSFQEQATDRLVGIDVVGKKYPGCFELFADRSLEERLKICNSGSRCGASNVSISGAINVNLTTAIKNELVQKIMKSIKNNIKSVVAQETGLIQFGDTIESSITVYESSIVNIISTFVEITATTIQQSQQLRIQGTSVDVVSLEAFSEVLETNVLGNSVYQAATVQLATQIEVIAKQQFVLLGPLDLLFTICGILILGAMIFGTALKLINEFINYRR